jgi:hypothetical protein
VIEDFVCELWDHSKKFALIKINISRIDVHHFVVGLNVNLAGRITTCSSGIRGAIHSGMSQR